MNQEQIYNELEFKAVRSSGAGGQHVNKVATKVELSFSIPNSLGLSDTEKERLLKNLANRLSKEHILTLTSQESRSQHKNKELVTKRFFELLKKALIKPKLRRATKPTRASVKRRIEAKKQQSEKKENRKKFRF